MAVICFFVGNPGQTVSSFSPDWLPCHRKRCAPSLTIHDWIRPYEWVARFTKTVFACYASKRRAEVAPGVGKDTDLAVLSNKGMFKADKTTLDSLEDLYLEYQKPASDVLMKKGGGDYK